jgi:hypothetical protein
MLVHSRGFFVAPRRHPGRTISTRGYGCRTWALGRANALPYTSGARSVLPTNPAEIDCGTPADEASRLCSEAERRLRRAGYLALHDIRCELASGVLRLHGRVGSYYLKQVAQAVVATVAGASALENHIEIVGRTARCAPAVQDRN